MQAVALTLSFKSNTSSRFACKSVKKEDTKEGASSTALATTSSCTCGGSDAHTLVKWRPATFAMMVRIMSVTPGRISCAMRIGFRRPNSCEHAHR